MPQLTSDFIKSMVKDFGADLVGIASVDRFEGAPPGHGPLDLMPQSKSVVVADYRGLTVGEINELRTRMRNASVEYRVAKNRLVRRAVAECGFDPLDEVLQGPSAFAIGYEDPVSPAKVLAEFGKSNGKLRIKGGWLGKQALTIEAIQNLASLPSREQLLARLMGSLKSPAGRLAIGLHQSVAKLAYAVRAVADARPEEA